MAVKLRLTRMGKKRKPFYRVVVQESSFARDGRFLEILGHYDPADYPGSIVLKEDRVKEWLGKGALPTPAVKKLLTQKRVLG